MRREMREVTTMRHVRMRAFGLSAVLLFVAPFVAGQPPARGAAPPRPAGRPGPRTPDGDLAQVMRGILFPNSNLLFDVQQNDPGAPAKKPNGDAGGDASKAFANVYTGWQVVEGA